MVKTKIKSSMDRLRLKRLNSDIEFEENRFKSCFNPHLSYNLDSLTQLCNDDIVKSIIKLIDKINPDIKKIKILDFGCGRGELLKGLKERGYKNIFGVDIDPYCIKLSSQFAPIFSSIQDFKSITDLKIVDIVVLSHILEHFANPSALLKEIREIANKYIIVAVPNPLATSALFKTIMRKPQSLHPTHYCSWDAGELYNVLEVHNGFKVIYWQGDRVTIFPYENALRFLSKSVLVFIKKVLSLIEVAILPSLFPFFTTSLICLCERQEK